MKLVKYVRRLGKKQIYEISVGKKRTTIFYIKNKFKYFIFQLAFLIILIIIFCIIYFFYLKKYPILILLNYYHQYKLKKQKVPTFKNIY